MNNNRIEFIEEMIAYAKETGNYSYYDLKAYAIKEHPEWLEVFENRKLRTCIATYLKSAKRKAKAKYPTPLYVALDNLNSEMEKKKND